MDGIYMYMIQLIDRWISLLLVGQHMLCVPVHFYHMNTSGMNRDELVWFITKGM